MNILSFKPMCLLNKVNASFLKNQASQNIQSCPSKSSFPCFHELSLVVVNVYVYKVFPMI